MSDRIKQIRVFLALSQADFGARIGITRSSVSKLESGENNPSEQTIKLICREFNINYDWLKYGTGTMKNPPDTADELVDRIMTGEDSFAKSVMRAFAKLDDKEWLLLKKIIDTIHDEER